MLQECPLAQTQIHVDDVEMTSVHEVTPAVEAVEFWEDIGGPGTRSRF